MVEVRRSEVILQGGRGEFGVEERTRANAEQAWYIVLCRTRLRPRLTNSEFADTALVLFRTRNVSPDVLQTVMGDGIEIARRFRRESGLEIDEGQLAAAVERVNGMITESGFLEAGQNA